MLENLHVKNLALIDETEISFREGLNILTGETGAGKSLILGSAALAMGAKAQKGMIREGAQEALVELSFTVESERQREMLGRLDIFPEDGRVLLMRRLSQNARSVSRINGETVSAERMRQAAQLLIAIHGQHEHEALLIRKNHLSYLDTYAKEELAAPLETLRESWRNWQNVRRSLEENTADRETRTRELAFLRFEIEEIEKAKPKPGEDEQLETDYRRLLHAQKIREALGEAREYAGSGGASEQIGRAIRSLMAAAEYDEKVKELADRFRELDILLSDLNMDLSAVLDDMENSEEALAETEERLNEINHLKAKYGKTINAVMEGLEERKKRADLLEHYEEHIAAMEREAAKAKEELDRQADVVHEIRARAAEPFKKAVEKALSDLNFPQVCFEVCLEKKEQPGENGYDDVRFLLTTNPGEKPKPLENVASGGELSRIMLGLKTILAESDELDTMIFDEIDAGISGQTAQKVAEKLKEIAGVRQVICITHLPQIAAMADHHFLIEKTGKDGRTISRIRPLAYEESIRELGRMLGGARITESVLNNARELKEMAHK